LPNNLRIKLFWSKNALYIKLTNYLWNIRVWVKNKLFADYSRILLLWYTLWILITVQRTTAGAEPETIDRGCPVQINRMFWSKKIYFLPYDLYFSVNRGGARTPAGAYLSSAPTRRDHWISSSWFDLLQISNNPTN
jgi:hypothetical protein